jgi:predicted DNA repair protein MutK
MPSGLVALLDDIAGITKLAAASLDDVGAAAGKAGTKAIGVVVDDTAVTPRYVVGLSPQRELPIIGKIALGSLRNKLLILLPAALLLSAFAPWAITPLLMLGGAYLCFEGAEKVIEVVTGAHHDDGEEEALDAAALEKSKVSGAVRTDLILSAEIMAIALGEVSDSPILAQGVILALVGIGITIGVYGVVALIVKMDDIGLHLAERNNAAVQAIGRGLVAGMPILMSAGDRRHRRNDLGRRRHPGPRAGGAGLCRAGAFHPPCGRSRRACERRYRRRHRMDRHRDRLGIVRSGDRCCDRRRGDVGPQGAALIGHAAALPSPIPVRVE